MIVGDALFLDRVDNSQRNTIRGNVEGMEPAPIQILSRAAFDLMLLSAGRHWVVSIREEEANPIPRPEFSGRKCCNFSILPKNPSLSRFCRKASR
jgi:hypothetical protein